MQSRNFSEFGISSAGAERSAPCQKKLEKCHFEMKPSTFRIYATRAAKQCFAIDGTALNPPCKATIPIFFNVQVSCTCFCELSKGELFDQYTSALQAEVAAKSQVTLPDRNQSQSGITGQLGLHVHDCLSGRSRKMSTTKLGCKFHLGP